MKIPGHLIPPRPLRSRLPRIVGLSDMERAPDPFHLLSRLPTGSGLIWRAYGEKINRTRLHELSRAARRAHVSLFLASTDKPYASSLPVHRHLPEHFLKTSHTDGLFLRQRRSPPQTIILAAAHSERAVIAAARAGVDAVLISPVFASQSHPGKPCLGITRFAALAHLARARGLAVYALGGINNASKIRRLCQSGATGIAAIELFISDDQA